MQQVYSESENQIQLECSSRSVRNQRIRYNQNAAGLLRIRESDTIRVQQVHSEWRYKYSCHCKALRAHLEMRCSTDVRTTRQADKRNKGSIIEDQQEVGFGLFYFFLFCTFALCKKVESVQKPWLTSVLLPFGSSLQFLDEQLMGPRNQSPCAWSANSPLHHVYLLNSDTAEKNLHVWNTNRTVWLSRAHSKLKPHSLPNLWTPQLLGIKGYLPVKKIKQE